MAAAVAAIGVSGLLIGSFLNVVIHRLPAGESLVRPGSHCPACGAAVKPYDNLPVFSWLLLRGQCRSCGNAISARYPIVEVVTGATFAAVGAIRGLDVDLALELPFFAVLITVAFIDFDHKIIPNKIILPAALYGVAVTAMVRTGFLPEALIAGASAFLFLLVAALAYPAGMGMGDVKLAGVMGIFLGSAVAPALLAAFASGAIVGLLMIVREGAAARKKGVPFGPFLAIGGLIGVLAGPSLVGLYVDRFL